VTRPHAHQFPPFGCLSASGPTSAFGFAAIRKPPGPPCVPVCAHSGRQLEGGNMCMNLPLPRDEEEG
jgi:hypothetical protein